MPVRKQASAFNLIHVLPHPNPLPTERAFVFPAFLKNLRLDWPMIVHTDENVIGEILACPSSPRFDAIAPKPKAKAEVRRHR